MAKEKNSSSSETSVPKRVLQLTTLVTLATAVTVKGYCDAQNIPLEKESLELTLKYGPPIVMGTLGAGIGGLIARI